MSTILRIPKAAVSMQEGILTSWLVADGQAVTEGQPIYTLELEKSSMDVEAPANGVLKHVGVAGTTYKVGEVIGEIKSEAAAAAAPHEVVVAPGSIYHTGYVVRDIHQSVRHWVEQVGAGPFVLFEHFQFVNAVYRGKPVSLEATLGFAYSGDSCIELIQPPEGIASIYSEAKGALHHVGIGVANLDAGVQRYAAAGIDCAFRAAFAFGGGCAYLDTVDRIGVFTELVETGPVVDGMLAQMRQAHKSWNRHDHTFTLS